MILATESQLMLLAAAIYVVDCSRLLHANEGILVRRRSGWIARFGSRRLRLAGKDIYVAHLLAPHRRMHRLAWDFEAPGARTASSPLREGRELGVLALPVWTVFVALFVILPFALFGRAGSAATLLAVVMVYASVLSLVALLVLYRKDWGLSPRQAALLAFECVVCPPLAINTVRKISLATPCDESLVTAARRLLGDPAERAAFEAECRARVDEEIEMEDEGSARMSRLLAARGQFAAAVEPT